MMADFHDVDRITSGPDGAIHVGDSANDVIRRIVLQR